MTELSYEKYLLKDKMPLFWCAGCGNGIVVQAIARAFADLQYNLNETVVVTGIGCWGKADDYFSTNTFHGTHGRALPFATGIKLANPNLNVVVLMGDGDGATIGGNHLIHAARRNVGVTAIMVNNLNYGMTGGQYSGTTPHDSITSTSPYGHVETGFDVCKLLEGAGSPFVARANAYNVVQLQKLIKEALTKKSFSFVEVISPCPTHFGKHNKMRTAPKMLNWIKDNSISVNSKNKFSDEELKDKFIVGKLVDKNISEDYSSRYEKMSKDIK